MLKAARELKLTSKFKIIRITSDLSEETIYAKKALNEIILPLIIMKCISLSLYPKTNPLMLMEKERPFKLRIN
jgi:hypothetical protein